MPTHYAFIVGASFDSIGRSLESVQQQPKDQLRESSRLNPSRWNPKSSQELDQQVAKIIADLDDRGAWVEPGRLRYHGDDDPTREVIRSATFSDNLRTLARWLAADLSE